MSRVKSDAFKDMKKSLKAISDVTFLECTNKSKKEFPHHKGFYEELERSDLFKELYFDGFTAGIIFGKKMVDRGN